MNIIDNFDEIEDEIEEDTKKDKYLLFSIDNEEYGIGIAFLKEIICMQKITEVPNMEDYIKGVINLRGKIIPVIDVRIRFNLNFKPYHDRTCIIIVNLNNTNIGLIIDSVSEVVIIPENNMEQPPKTNKIGKTNFIKSMGKIGGKVKIILNIENILTNQDLEQINENESK